jgi:ABC-type transport system involved in multi-copper enzyme maturation permease subunit
VNRSFLKSRFHLLLPGGSEGTQRWKERLGGVVVLGGAGSMVGLGRVLTPWQQLLGWALLAAVVAVLVRWGWVKLIGPVFYFDLVRIERRMFARRCLYAGLLLVVLFLVSIALSNQGPDDPWKLFLGTDIPARQMADVAAAFSAAFLSLQFFIACTVAPIAVAAAIPEAKQRRVLEFLLATDLRNHELILGTLLARLAHVGLLLLAGLPVLSFLQLLGGVDPDIVLVSFGLTALTALSLSSLAVLNSVYARRPLTAVMLTYLQVGIYLGLSGAAYGLLLAFPWLSGYPSTDEWLSPVSVQDVVDVLGTGNPGIAVFELELGLRSGAPLADLLWPLIVKYAWFQGVVIAGALAWAVLRVRRAAMRQASAAVRRDDSVRGRWFRFPVGLWPMLWKEMFSRPTRRRWFIRLGAALVVLGIAGSALAILGVFYLTIPFIDWYDLRLAMHAWVRVTGMMTACLLFLQVATRAAGSITSERDRHTLDDLLTTPVRRSNILVAKWLGSILGSRRTWLGLVLIWLTGWYTGGLHLADIPGLLLASLVFAAALAGMGLLVSTLSATTSRALPAVALLIIVAWGSHWMLIPLGAWTLGLDYDDSGPLFFFQCYALTPPVALDFLASRLEERGRPIDVTSMHNFRDGVGWCGVGLVIWLGVALLLLWWADHRFRSMTRIHRPKAAPEDAAEAPLVA